MSQSDQQTNRCPTWGLVLSGGRNLAYALNAGLLSTPNLNGSRSFCWTTLMEMNVVLRPSFYICYEYVSSDVLTTVYGVVIHY